MHDTYAGGTVENLALYPPSLPGGFEMGLEILIRSLFKKKV
jgi:hypothetical protein